MQIPAKYALSHSLFFNEIEAQVTLRCGSGGGVCLYLLHFSCPVSKTTQTVHHVGKNERALSYNLGNYFCSVCPSLQIQFHYA